MDEDLTIVEATDCVILWIATFVQCFDIHAWHSTRVVSCRTCLLALGAWYLCIWVALTLGSVCVQFCFQTNWNQLMQALTLQRKSRHEFDHVFTQLTTFYDLAVSRRRKREHKHGYRRWSRSNYWQHGTRLINNYISQSLALGHLSCVAWRKWRSRKWKISICGEIWWKFCGALCEQNSNQGLETWFIHSPHTLTICTFL